MNKYVRSFLMLLSVGAIISSIGLVFSYFPGNSGSNNNTQFPLAYGASSSDTLDRFSKTKSGLVAEDPLTNDSRINTDYWELNGSAPDMNARYSTSENSSGLHIGVQAPFGGQWAGYFAVTPESSAHLYHAVLGIPFKTVPDHWWDTGLYVQTASPGVNYVTCAAVVDNTTVNWAVYSTKGDINQATEFHTLWSDNRPDQPYTRDCTIITNGNNSLKVYLDNKLVYSNDTLDLQMPSPFRAYLEAQSSTASQEFSGTYTDFYSTASQFVTVTSAPPGIEVDLVNSSTGSVLEKGTAGPDGSLHFDVGKYHMPLDASIKAYDFSGNLVANSGAMSIWGGDEYEMASPVSTDGNNANAPTNDNTNSNNDNNNNNINPNSPHKDNAHVRSVIEGVLKPSSYDGTSSLFFPSAPLTSQLKPDSLGIYMPSTTTITTPFDTTKIGNGYLLHNNGKMFEDGQKLTEKIQKQAEQLQKKIDGVIYQNTYHLKEQ